MSNIYECDAIIKKVEDLACQNEGELTEGQLKELTEAHTGSIEALGKLCGYMKHLEHRSSLCKMEEARIKELRGKSETRLASIKKYLTPYVQEKGKQDIGTFKLSMRKSKAVELDEWFDVTKESNMPYVNTKTTKSPDKKAIKDALSKGIEIVGAKIKTNQNLQFK